MKILADENIPLIHELFDSLGEVVTVPPRSLSPELIADVDALVVRSVATIDENLLKNSPVKFVGTCTAGTDHLDTDYMDRAGITWSGAPCCNANSVVEYVFSCWAALDVSWQTGPVGIIGCGNVGGRLYRRLKSLGVDCRCYDPFLSAADNPDLVDLPAVLQCPFISIHAPLTRSGPHPSFHLLGEAELDLLPQGALLISAGRGAVVDNKVLLEVLTKRDDLRAVLDVWEGEPVIDRELLAAVSLGTPHIAGHSYDGKVAGTEMIYRRLCRFLNREPALSFADFDTWRPSSPVSVTADSPGAAINEAILQVYDVRADDAKLRAALTTTDPGAAFDGLRKHYPRRRESSGYPVTVRKGDERVRQALALMGFAL